MEREKLLRKLEVMLDAAQRERMWGNIEVEIRDGVPVILRKATTEKLQDDGENNRGNYRP